MKNKAWFLIKFLCLSVILFFIWIFIGRYYLITLATVSKSILSLMGYNASLIVQENIFFIYRGVEIGLTHSELTNYNIISFLALIFASPITRLRMKKALLIGIPIIFLLHLCNLIAHFPLYFDGNIIANIVVSMSAITSMMIPFLLWFAFTYDYLLNHFRTKKKKYQCPICGKQAVGVLKHIQSVHGKNEKESSKQIQEMLKEYPELNDS